MATTRFCGYDISFDIFHSIPLDAKYKDDFMNFVRKMSGHPVSRLDENCFWDLGTYVDSATGIPKSKHLKLVFIKEWVESSAEELQDSHSALIFDGELDIFSTCSY